MPETGQLARSNGSKFGRLHIAVQPQCLLCHGPTEQIPDEIRMVLRKQYPFDAATDYKAEDLRGAVSIKAPIGKQD